MHGLESAIGNKSPCLITIASSPDISNAVVTFSTAAAICSPCLRAQVNGRLEDFENGSTTLQQYRNATHFFSNLSNEMKSIARATDTKSRDETHRSVGETCEVIFTRLSNTNAFMECYAHVTIRRRPNTGSTCNDCRLLVSRLS
jgi:hypothetical protein